MKLRKGSVILFDPKLCKTIGYGTSSRAITLGIVLAYDKYADCYDVDIGYDNLLASITPNCINRNSITVIGTY